MAFNLNKYYNCICEECGQIFNKTNGLARHITRGHKISLLEYFTKHGGAQSYCLCGKDNRWLLAKMAFSDHCSTSCSMKHTRKTRSSDMQYRLNISLAMKKVWANRSPEEIKRICLNSGKFEPLHSDDWIMPEQVYINLEKVFNMYGS